MLHAEDAQAAGRGNSAVASDPPLRTLLMQVRLNHRLGFTEPMCMEAQRKRFLCKFKRLN